MQETQDTGVQPLGGEDPLEEEMAMHSSILAWEIPWTEEPGGPQSMGSQSLSDLATKQQPALGRGLDWMSGFDKHVLGSFIYITKYDLHNNPAKKATAS